MDLPMGDSSTASQAEPRSGTLQIVESTDTYIVAIYDVYALVEWRTRLSLSGILTLRRAFEQLAAAAPARQFGYVCLIDPEANIRPPAQQGPEVARHLKAMEHLIHSAVAIYTATGFRATLVRSLITAVNIAGKLSFHSQVHASVDSGVRWIAGQLQPNAPDANVALEHALQELCAFGRPPATEPRRVRS
jgi:hypothetical protein